MQCRVSEREFTSAYDRVIANDGFFEGAQYYRDYRDRYLNTFRYLPQYLPEEPGARMLDIGSGQFAVLGRQLLGLDTAVADVDTRCTDVLSRSGVEFYRVDLSRETLVVDRPFDLIVMAEVIEHVPCPPHLVFANLATALKPGGHMLVTTPNLYRLRNVIRMLRGEQIFDMYRIGEREALLGHFIEYSKEQIAWQLETAGLQVELAVLAQLSLGGSSVRARLARRILSPAFKLRPLWRDNVVAVGRKPL